MTDFYEEDRKLMEIRKRNLERDNELFGAIYNQKQQQELEGSNFLMLNDRSQDLVKIIKKQNDAYNDVALAKGEALRYLQNIASREDANDILYQLSDAEIFILVKNQSYINKELKKYSNLTPIDFIKLIRDYRINPMSIKKDPIPVPSGYDRDADGEPVRKRGRGRDDDNDDDLPEVEARPVNQGDDIYEPFKSESSGWYDDIQTILQSDNNRNINTFKTGELRELAKRYIEDGALTEDVLYSDINPSRTLTRNELLAKMRKIAKAMSKRAGRREARDPTEYMEVEETKDIEGNGLKARRNRRGMRVIHGRGLSAVDTPTTDKKEHSFKKSHMYYDKVFIDTARLKQNVLFIKYIYNNVSVGGLKTQTISNDLQEIIEDTINGRYNKKLFLLLNEQDKRIFRRVVKVLKLSLDLPVDDETAQFKENYKILVGSYMAGNDNPDVKKQLLAMVRQGIAMSVIPSQEAWSLLYELSN